MITAESMLSKRPALRFAEALFFHFKLFWSHICCIMKICYLHLSDKIFAGYLSEDSGVETEKQTVYVKDCSVSPPCEPPPLYDDVIALRNRGIV